MSLSPAMLAIVVSLLGFALLIVTLWLSRRATRPVRRGEAPDEELARAHLGSARVGGVYGTIPFGSLSIGRSWLAVSMLGRECRVTRDQIKRIVVEPGLLSRGIRIEHVDPDQPPEPSFWTPSHQQVFRDLEEMGWEVVDLRRRTKPDAHDRADGEP